MRLLQAKADPFVRYPRHGSQAIHLAAQAGEEEVVSALLALGRSVDKPNHYGQRPIDLAPILFRATLVKFGAAPMRGSALKDAVSYGDRGLAVRLLDEGKVDLHARDREGNLCTHLAARSGAADLLQTLVERGVSIHERNFSEQQVDFFARTADVKSDRQAALG